MTANFDDELVQHVGALRGLARALVGASEASDLVQDTALVALQQPPSRTAGMFGWLSAVLRHRAMKYRRSERRRVAREQRIAAQADESESPSPLGAAQHREIVARLDAALLGLPQPYQDTLLLRYFEDLTPSEIAVRTAEPLATVKSRLQRGLAMLRQRLDADRNGADWRAGLVATFGLGRHAATTVMTVGIVLMTTKLVLVAAAAVLAGILLWPRGAPVAPLAVASGANATDAVVAASATENPRPSDREVVLVEPAAPSAVAGSTTTGITFSGRCIDELGAPLSGVRVEARTIIWNGGKVLAESDLTTTADGAFDLELPIADGAANRLELHANARCTLEGQVDDARAGERRDLGDLVLSMAYAFRGHVVDVIGTPQVGVRVLLAKDQFSSGARALMDVWIGSQMATTTDDLGAFAFDTELPAGTYRLQLGNRQLVDASNSKITLEGSRRERALELVVEPAPPSCRGIVVRADGSPIAGARVSLDDNEVRTGADGHFELMPNPNRGRGERRIEVSADGFLLERDQVWRYGDANQVRVVLRSTAAVTLRVVDGRTATPVCRYAAQLVQSNTWRLGHEVPRGEHANGTSSIPAPPGNYLVLVTPESDELMRSTFQPVQLPADRSAEVTVTLWPPLQRRLVVTDGRAPVAGVNVQLLDPGDVQVRCDTETWTLEDNRVSGPPLARIVQRGETAEDGSLVLRGPKGPLALRLSGAGLALQIVQPVSLDGADELTITSPRGATWRGKLVPARVAGELFAFGQSSPNTAPTRVGIDLVRDDGESLHRVAEDPFPFAADGSFEIRGIPSGTWHAVVKAKSAYAAATITTAPGQTLERDLDVNALAAADVTLRVLVDGAPAADSYVNAMGRHATDVFGRRFASQTVGRTDADGRFTLRTFVGDLDVHVYWRSESGKESILFANAAVPQPGQQEIVLDLRLGELAVDLLRPDGTPATGVDLREAGQTGASWTTDAEGQLRVKPFVAGAHVLEARPRSLTTAGARSTFAQVHDWMSLEHEWVPCGVVTVPGGRSKPQRLQLPPAWDR